MKGFYNRTVQINVYDQSFHVEPVENRLTLFDALILCRFYRDLYQWEELSTIIEGTTGLRLTKDDIRSIASSITDNTRRFNLREGLTSKDDHLPNRFHSEPLESGKVITQNEMGQLLNEYYQARRWDKIGIPPAE